MRARAKEVGTTATTAQSGVRSVLLRRQCACGRSGGRCGECDRERLSLQRSADKTQSHPSVPTSVHQTLRSAGRPLDAQTRSFMESRFGHDFSRVRIHTDAKASESAAAVSARAYTVGRDVVFAAGQYAPHSAGGMRLLAHELAHTIQQGRAGDGVAAASELEVGPADDPFERAADAAADAALSGPGRAVAPAAAPRRAPAARLQRQPDGTGAKTKTPATDPVTDFVLAGSGKVKWRVGYDTKQQAQGVLDRVRKLRLKAEDIVADGKVFTFYYYPLTKAEAEAVAAKRQASAGAKYKVEAKEDSFAKSWYVGVTLKCPEAIPAKASFSIWHKCFPGEADAKTQVGKFEAARVEAQVVKVDDKQFGVYYKPMTEAEAKAAGTAAAKTRPGFDKGMYEVQTAERTDLKSFTYSMKTTCPAGYKDLGSFHVSSYAIANEGEFDAGDTVENPCGLTGTFRRKFLFETKKSPRGVKMQGSGKSLGGKYIHYKKPDCFEVVSCAQTSTRGVCAVKGRTAAVNYKFIPRGSTILIEDIGERVAEDTGDAFKGNARKIDIYQGEDISMAETNRLTYGEKKACRKKTP